MIVFESRKQRRVLARLERGEDPVRSLVELAEAETIRAAWVRGVGALEWAELDRHDPERGAPTPSLRIDEACEALSVEGHLAIEGGAPVVTLHATLAVPSPGIVGGRIVGGRLVAAAAYSLELVVDVFEDVRLERVEDADTGLWVWAGTSTRAAAAAPAEAPARRSTELRAGRRRQLGGRGRRQRGARGRATAALEHVAVGLQQRLGPRARAAADPRPIPRARAGARSAADEGRLRAAPPVRDLPRGPRRRRGGHHPPAAERRAKEDQAPVHGGRQPPQ